MPHKHRVHRLLRAWEAEAERKKLLWHTFVFLHHRDRHPAAAAAHRSTAAGRRRQRKSGSNSTSGAARAFSSEHTMKLLTHNMLACTIKGVKNGFPLKIEATEVVEREADFDPGECERRLVDVAAHGVGSSGGGDSTA